MRRCYRAQGATEYLVLLAVVLIVALVSVALLGFFPGMASDAQLTQSQTYWQSATPIAIVEMAVKAHITAGVGTYPYLKVKNTGAYPIRITGVIGGNGDKTVFMYGGASAACGTPIGRNYNISDYFYMAPGEEKYFAWAWSGSGIPCDRQLRAVTGAASGYDVGGASSVCQNTVENMGTLNYKSFGFEYVVYIDGQQITKREIGRSLIIKCLPAST